MRVRTLDASVYAPDEYILDPQTKPGVAVMVSWRLLRVPEDVCEITLPNASVRRAAIGETEPVVGSIEDGGTKMGRPSEVMNLGMSAKFTSSTSAWLRPSE